MSYPEKRFEIIRVTIPTGGTYIHKLPIVPIKHISIHLPEGYVGYATLSGYTEPGLGVVVARCHLQYGLGHLYGPFPYDVNWREFYLTVISNADIILCIAIEYEEWAGKPVTLPVTSFVQPLIKRDPEMTLPIERRVAMR